MAKLRPRASCGHAHGDRSRCCDQQRSTYGDGIRDGERALDCSVERCASWLKSSKSNAIENKRAAESRPRPLLLKGPLWFGPAKVNMTHGSFWFAPSLRQILSRSRLNGGKGGRTLNRFRRNAQLVHSLYSGWRLLIFAYRRFAHSEFFSTSAKPMGKRISAPGPGNQPINGARMIKPQPRTIIAH
jgi:hypothetical protein